MGQERDGYGRRARRERDECETGMSRSEGKTDPRMRSEKRDTYEKVVGSRCLVVSCEFVSLCETARANVRRLQM